MKRAIIAFMLTGLFFSCYSNPNGILLKNGCTDTIPKKPRFSMDKGDRPDSEQASPSLKDERKKYLETYNKTITIDTSFKKGKNVYRVKMKYYCLNKSSLIIPKNYNWAEKSKKVFATHEFASKIIVIINNRDTVFNKIILKKDFTAILKDQLKKYAILLPPNFSRYNKEKDEIVLQYSISIPVTDLGTSAYLVINKNGSFKVMSNYK